MMPTDDAKLKSEIIKNHIAILNHWTYGFSQVGLDFGLRYRFFYEVEKKALSSFLRENMESLGFESAIESCKWYNDRLKNQIQIAEKTMFKGDSRGIKISVEGCLFSQACLAEKAEGLPNLCYRGLALAVWLETQFSKPYDISVEEFSPPRECQILLSESPLLSLNHAGGDIALASEIDEIAISLIKLGDEGPEAIFSTPLHFLKDKSERAGTEFLNNIAIFYLTAIAQASAYHEGLFGPLPVKDYGHQEVMLFSFRTADKSLQDHRFRGQGYFFFIIFLRKGTAHNFARSRLEKFLKEYTKSIKDVSQIDRSLLNELGTQITIMINY
ncbi:MAG: hypothetical protein ACFFC7_08935 [Candidatus Hermodarchaeota archaeon]